MWNLKAPFLAVTTRRSPRIELALLAALGLSCLSGPRPPVVAPQRTLGLGAADKGTKVDGPFRVAHASPEGETDEPSEVNILFSRPMRPLELAGTESAPPATLVAVEGRSPRGEWKWLGTSALTFAPSEPLARATKYRVTVPAGTRALDGSTLAAAHVVEFSTPRPHMVSSQPASGFQHLLPSAPIELLFNQPVALATLEKELRFELPNTKRAAIKVKASYPKADVPTRVQVLPASPLPLDADVTLTGSAELRGTEGPLPTDHAVSVALRTFGPQRVDAVDCYKDTPNKKCSARDGFRVELKNRVRLRDFARSVVVEPATRLDWGARLRSGDDRDLTSSVHLPARLGPARSYRVTVKAGLKDEFGQALASDQSFTMETDDEWPEVEVGLAGTVFDAPKKAPPAIPVASVNVKEIELAAVAFDEASYAKWVATRRRRGSQGYPSLLGAGAKQTSVAPGAAPNARHVFSLDLAKTLGRSTERGLFAFGLRAKGGRNRNNIERIHTLASTDLGISAKMSRFGSLVWVTSLTTGKPIAGATVTVRRASGDEAFAGATDKDGLVAIPAERFDPAPPRHRADDDEPLLFARLGDDLAVRHVRDMLSPWQYASHTDPSGRLDPMGFVFADRGVYRPGETIRTKGLFRLQTPRGTSTPKGRGVDVRAFSAQGDEVWKSTSQLGEFGEFAVDVPIPPTVRLGSFEVRAELSRGPSDKGDDGAGVATVSVELAAYKASEFKVAVEPERPSFIRGDKAGFVVRGDYLFGAPMKGGKGRLAIRRGPGYFSLPLGEEAEPETFSWTDDTFLRDQPNTTSHAEQIHSSEGELGAKGEHAASVPLTLVGQRGTETLSIEGEVQDLTRQSVAAEASALVHPAEFYVALKRPKDAFVDEGARVEPSVLAIEPTGKRRAGVKVTLELLRRTWQTALRGSGEAAVTHETRVVDEPVESCTVVTKADAPAACPLTSKAAGYHVIHATTRDGRGNAASASQSLYVLSRGDGKDNGAPWRMTDGSQLELVSDKASYDVGDVATILIKNPYPEAEALVTLERAGITKTERRTLRGPTPTVKVPVTAEMYPNVFVGVHLVRGRTKDRPLKGADVGAPAFRLGYATLAIRPDDRRLKVQLTPSQKELRPGQEIEVDVSVTNRRGEPVRANATVYAVDEGVLMLTGYKTPDPLPTFGAQRPLAVFSLENRDDLARIFRLSPARPGEDKGADGGGGGEGMRADFRSTAFFEPSLLVDKGRAKVRFKLPDALTTYRIMAVVADPGDRFGFGDTQVITSRRLMLRPALPRFFRTGDVVEAGVIVTTKGLGKTVAEVSLEASGIDVEGDLKQRVSLEASGQAEVKFRFKPSSAGTATLNFRASAERESDALRLTKTVSVPTTMEAVALAGVTDTASAEQLGDLRSIRPDVGGLEVSLSSSALVGLDGAVKQVLEYPYGCTEQLTSRLVPYVLAADLLPFVGAPAPKDAPRTIADTIGRILKSQKPDGTFGYWTDSSSGDAWLTAYVTWALTDAKKRGHAVPSDALDAALQALHTLSRERKGKLGLAQSAFIADVLAVSQRPDGGLMTELYGERQKMPLFARALLAHAYAIAPKDGPQSGVPRAEIMKELFRDLDNHIRITPAGAIVATNLGGEYAPLLDSDARTTALVLRALVTAEPNHPLGGRLARGLVGLREGGAFRSTQEASFALVALDTYRKAQEGAPIDFDARVFLGETLLHENHFESATAVVANVPARSLMAGPGTALTFQALGSGRLFYEARLRYARTDLPRDSLDRGLFVKKTMRAVKPDQIEAALLTAATASATSVNAGDLVLVDLYLVTATPRTQVVLDDPLPGGLEAIDTRLRTSSRAAALVSSGPSRDGDDQDEEDERANGRGELTAPFHREVHDDKVLTFVEDMAAGIYHYRYLARATSRGRFVVPATRAECMYEPEVFGRTAGQVFEVR